MKRRSHTPKKLRDRRSGKSPYARWNKIPYRYLFKRDKKEGPSHEHNST